MENTNTLKTLRAKRVRPRSKPIPAEGENGLFTESWFVVCMSSEVSSGQVIGRSFLDGRIVIFRGENGVAEVFSAYCPHMGADLAAGKVVGNNLQCGFHHWEFDSEGWCNKTGLGEPPPKTACLYKYHVVEKFGLIFVFNGDEPWWEIPDYPKAESEIAFSVNYDVPTVPVDPWVICANTPDWQHLKAVHRLKFDHELLFERIDWTDHSMEYDMDATFDQGSGISMQVRSGIYGTSFFRMHGEIMGKWFCAMTAFQLVAPGVTQVYYSFGTDKSNGSTEDDMRVAMTHEMLFGIAKSIIADDRPILHSLKYTPGVMTISDKALAKYLSMVRNFPRSHDSADFIK